MEFCFFEIETGKLNLDCIRIECQLCKTKNANCILYNVKFFEWHNREFVRLIGKGWALLALNA